MAAADIGHRRPSLKGLLHGAERRDPVLGQMGPVGRLEELLHAAEQATIMIVV